MNSRRRLVSATVVTALALAACGGGSDDATGDDEADVTALATDTVDEPVETSSVTVDTEPAPTATEPPPAEEEPAPELESGPAPEPEPEPAPAPDAAGSDGSCLVGEWVITEDELNDYHDALESLFSTDGPALTFDIVGDAFLTFGETEYTYVADFGLTLEVIGQTGTGTSTGTVSGDWDVVDGVVTTTLGSSDLDVVIDLGGRTVTGSDFANGLLDSAPISNAPFDCDGPTLGFQADADGDIRHDVLLTPA